MARRPTIQALLVAALCLTAATARAQIQPGSPAMTAAGGYLLSTEGGARRCMLLLRAIAVPHGHAIGFPLQCRVALPVLGEAAAWTVERDGPSEKTKIRFLDTKGEALLTFDRPGDKDGLVGKDREGKTYELQPGDGRSLAVRFGAPPAAARQRQSAPTGPSTGPENAGDLRLMTETAGRYDFLRGPERPTGCVLTLALPAGAGAAATLAPACPDRGITFFAPERWSIAGNTLWLLNGRGQKISFSQSRRGSWEKSAGQGEPLLMQRRQDPQG